MGSSHLPKVKGKNGIVATQSHTCFYLKEEISSLKKVRGTPLRSLAIPLPATFSTISAMPPLLAEVGPNKAASANVETVFSGAGQFAEEARTASAKLLRQAPQASLQIQISLSAHPCSDGGEAVP